MARKRRGRCRGNGILLYYEGESKREKSSDESLIADQQRAFLSILRGNLPQVKVRNSTRGVVLGDTVMVADASGTRRTGLLKHDRLKSGEGLWIVPCEAVHTFGMKFSIDVLFLNKKKQVLKIRKDMVKRRIAMCLWAHSVLELPAGMAEQTGTVPGDQLEFE